MSYVVGVKKKFNLNLKLSVPESNVMWYVSYERKSQRELCRADYRAPGTARERACAPSSVAPRPRTAAASTAGSGACERSVFVDVCVNQDVVL